MATTAPRALITSIRTSALPAKGTDTIVANRADDYGGLFILDSMLSAHTQALEGSRFVARAIPAVGGVGVVAGSFVTVFSDTAKLSLSLVNGEAASGKTYVLDFLRARVIVAPTGATSCEARAEVDTTNRYSSGGTALVVYKANPSASAPASLATVRSGDVTAAAAGANRQHVGQVLVKKAAAPCLVVDEIFTFAFGAIGTQPAIVSAAPIATTAIAGAYHMNSCAVPPGGTFLFQLATPGAITTPMQWDLEVAWIER